jgi:cell division septation protein DedD
MWIGCSSPKETAEDSQVTELVPADTNSVVTPVQTPEVKVQEKPKSTVQRFSVQADTVDVQRKKRQGSASTSISVKAAAPKKFYTVEVGAFKMQSNVKRHQRELSTRFKLPVRVFFDSTIHLTRVCVGNFSSKSSANTFLDKMKQQYPKDYPDLWVSYWTK